MDPRSHALLPASRRSAAWALGRCRPVTQAACHLDRRAGQGRDGRGQVDRPLAARKVGAVPYKADTPDPGKVGSVCWTRHADPRRGRACQLDQTPGREVRSVVSGGPDTQTPEGSCLSYRVDTADRREGLRVHKRGHGRPGALTPGPSPAPWRGERPQPPRPLRCGLSPRSPLHEAGEGPGVRMTERRTDRPPFTVVRRPAPCCCPRGRRW